MLLNNYSIRNEKLKTILKQIFNVYQVNGSIYNLLFNLIRQKVTYNNSKKAYITIFESDIINFDPFNMLFDEIKEINLKTFDLKLQYQLIDEKYNSKQFIYEDSNVLIKINYSLSKNITKTDFESNINALKTPFNQDVFVDLFLNNNLPNKQTGGVKNNMPVLTNVLNRNVLSDYPIERKQSKKPDDVNMEYDEFNLNYNYYELITFLSFESEFLLSIEIDEKIVEVKDKIIKMLNKNGADAEFISYLENNKLKKSFFDLNKHVEKYFSEKNEFDKKTHHTNLILENYKSSDFYIYEITVYDKKLNDTLIQNFEYETESDCNQYTKIILRLYAILSNVIN